MSFKFKKPDTLISLGLRIKNKRIFDSLKKIPDSWIAKYKIGKLDTNATQRLELLAALYIQDCDTSNQMFQRWYNFWSQNFISTDRVNSGSNNEKNIEKHWYCGKNMYFNALILNRLKVRGFSDATVDSIKELIKNQIGLFKFQKLIPPKTITLSPKKVNMPYELGTIENIDFIQTPIIKDSYDKYSYKRDFSVQIISYNKKALIYLYGDFDHLLYYVELIDKNSIALQLIEEKSIWQLL
jgi:hypothetical protein